MPNIPRFPELDGASVFITGGGSGIGATLVDGLLEQGAKVAFVDITDARDFVAEMAQKHGNAPLFLPCDVTDTTALHAAMDRAAAEHGPLAVLINNAANDTRYNSDEITEEIWDAMQAVNFRPYFFGCQKAAKMMRANGGSIINFSSITYMMGLAGMAPYLSANAGIMGLTRSLAREYGPDNIRVNAIAPGWILTERQKALWATPEAFAAHFERQCLKEALAPRDLLGTVLFLASDMSRMMTGQVLVLDGGVVTTG